MKIAIKLLKKGAGGEHGQGTTNEEKNTQRAQRKGGKMKNKCTKGRQEAAILVEKC